MNRKQIEQATLLLLRLVAALLIFQPGAKKIFGWFDGQPNGGTIAIGSQPWVGGWIEVIGGVLVFAGLCTRPVAFLLSGEMAVAYWQFHAPKGAWPVQNQGAPAVLLCFIFLYFAACGGGPWSLDALLKGKRSSTDPESEESAG
ncbi:MAG: DoxX family protein [Armatimonadetes bacterium]|nr:DoxX family protein [Armatimonadota bacterium]